jgi:hypothetical protein
LNSQNWRKETLLQISDFPYLISVTPDGKYLLVAKNVTTAYHHAVEVWEFGTWREVIELEGFERIYYARSIPAKKWVVTGDWK